MFSTMRLCRSRAWHGKIADSDFWGRGYYNAKAEPQGSVSSQRLRQRRYAVAFDATMFSTMRLCRSRALHGKIADSDFWGRGYYNILNNFCNITLEKKTDSVYTVIWDV